MMLEKDFFGEGRPRRSNSIGLSSMARSAQMKTQTQAGLQASHVGMDNRRSHAERAVKLGAPSRTLPKSSGNTANTPPRMQNLKQELASHAGESVFNLDLGWIHADVRQEGSESAVLTIKSIADSDSTEVVVTQNGTVFTFVSDQYSESLDASSLEGEATAATAALSLAFLSLGQYKSKVSEYIHGGGSDDTTYGVEPDLLGGPSDSLASRSTPKQLDDWKFCGMEPVPGYNVYMHDERCSLAGYEDGIFKADVLCAGEYKVNILDCCLEHDRALYCARNGFQRFAADFAFAECIALKIFTEGVERMPWWCVWAMAPILFVATQAMIVPLMTLIMNFANTFFSSIQFFNYDGRHDDSCLCGGDQPTLRCGCSDLKNPACYVCNGPQHCCLREDGSIFKPHGDARPCFEEVHEMEICRHLDLGKGTRWV